MPLPWSKPKPPVVPRPEQLPSTEEALKRYYMAKVQPVEDRHAFAQFYTPAIHANEFDAAGTVLLLGQYSVGKTTFVQFLMGHDYPGAKVGPEPTTDMFTVVKYAEKDREMYGPTIVSDDNFPFPSLDVFGQNFLAKLKVAACPAELLKKVTFIDTPGILTGEKQQSGRGYDFEQVVRFLADKVDRIYILFDCSKLDIGDEYKRILQSMRGNEEKLRIVLNKADAIASDELMRVRGALMWSLGKVLRCAEVPEVYIGSFWRHRIKNVEMKQAFAIDFAKLMSDLAELPKTSTIRKINDVAKRARMVRSHAYLMDYIMRRHMRLGKGVGAVKSAVRTKQLAATYALVMRRERIHPDDMPQTSAFTAAALRSDPRKWSKVDKHRMQWLNVFMDNDLACIIRTLPQDVQGLIGVLEPNFRALHIAPTTTGGPAPRFADERSKSKSKSDRAAPKSLPPLPAAGGAKGTEDKTQMLNEPLPPPPPPPHAAGAAASSEPSGRKKEEKTQKSPERRPASARD